MSRLAPYFIEHVCLVSTLYRCNRRYCIGHKYFNQARSQGSLSDPSLHIRKREIRVRERAWERGSHLQSIASSAINQSSWRKNVRILTPDTIIDTITTSLIEFSPEPEEIYRRRRLQREVDVKSKSHSFQ